MFLSNITRIELMLCYSWVGVFFVNFVSHLYWETFPIPTGKLFQFLLGKILPSHSGKCFPSLLGNVFHPYWELFPIPTEKYFLIPTRKGFPSWLGNISHTVGCLFHPYGWETFTLPNGILFSLLVVNISYSYWKMFYFHCLTWQFCQFFAIRDKPREFSKG